MTLKIRFWSESRSVKVFKVKNLISNPIGDNFKIAAYLFYVVYAKKSGFFGHF
jgi:hypothetical protein